MHLQEYFTKEQIQKIQNDKGLSGIITHGRWNDIGDIQVSQSFMVYGSCIFRIKELPNNKVIAHFVPNPERVAIEVKATDLFYVSI